MAKRKVSEEVFPVESAAVSAAELPAAEETPAGDAETSGGATVKKAKAIRDLLDEWSGQGRDIKSNTALLAELEKRYQGTKFTPQDVAQSKTKWLRSKSDHADEKPTRASVTSAAPTSNGADTPFVEQLRAAVALLGKEAVKKLVDAL